MLVRRGITGVLSLVASGLAFSLLASGERRMPASSLFDP